MTVSFATVREDFPPNVENLRIEHMASCFFRARIETEMRSPSVISGYVKQTAQVR